MKTQKKKKKKILVLNFRLNYKLHPLNLVKLQFSQTRILGYIANDFTPIVVKCCIIFCDFAEQNLG